MPTTSANEARHREAQQHHRLQACNDLGVHEPPPQGAGGGADMATPHLAQAAPPDPAQRVGVASPDGLTPFVRVFFLLCF